MGWWEDSLLDWRRGASERAHDEVVGMLSSQKLVSGSRSMMVIRRAQLVLVASHSELRRQQRLTSCGVPSLPFRA